MLGTILIAIVVIALMIGATALYVAGEFASVSARKPRLTQMAHEGNRLAKMIVPILEDPHRLDNYIAASQVGITLSSIVLGVYGQQQLAPLIQPLVERIPFLSSGAAAAGVSATLVLIFLTILQVVLGELVPKSIAIQYPEKVAMATAVPMLWSANIILRPLIILLNGSGTLILRLLGVRHEGGHRHIHSPEEIQLLIGQSTEGGLIDADNRNLLDNAFRMGELTAAEVAIPRTRMVAASIDTPVDQMLKLFAESDYTRIPVYETTIDHITGFVHLKDVFRLYHQQAQRDLGLILRKAPYVPETMHANDVWATMDEQQSYLAIVFDEYGGVVGMITREDLIEELFGEVQDEFDTEKPPIAPSGERAYLVRSDVLVSVVNEELGIDLSTEIANTIGGLVLHELGRIPAAGDHIRLDGVEIHVESSIGKALYELSLTLPPDRAAPTEEEIDL